MWFLHNLGWFALGFVFFAVICLVLETLWERVWENRQFKLRAKQGRDYREYHEERLFDNVAFMILVSSVLGAWFLLRYFMGR